MGVGAHSHMMLYVAARHSCGLSAVPLAAQPCVSKRDGPPAVREPRRIQTRLDSFERANGSYKAAGLAGWGERVTCNELMKSRPPGRRGASPRRGRVAGPDVSGGKARQICALVARGARAGIRGAPLGLAPSPRHRNRMEIGVKRRGSCIHLRYTVLAP